MTTKEELINALNAVGRFSTNKSLTKNKHVAGEPSYVLYYSLDNAIANLCTAATDEFIANLIVRLLKRFPKAAAEAHTMFNTEQEATRNDD
jgi:hypothetical protein